MLEINIARDVGWTLDYIRSLSIEDIGIYLAVRSAEAKITKAEQEKSKNKGRH